MQSSFLFQPPRLQVPGGSIQDVRAAEDDVRAECPQLRDRIISIYQPHLRPIVGALCLVFAKTGLETLKKRVLSTIDDLVGVLSSPQVSWGKIN